MLVGRRRSGYAVPALVILSAAVLLAARAALPIVRAAPVDKMVLQGRALVLNHGCGGCHGGHDDPSAPGWLAGEMTPDQQFLIGPCAFGDSTAKPCFRTHPRNLTPDNETGLGRFTERQIFNALRYGLRPEDTPDVTVTSTTPGQGNHPLHPHYLAPPMPWPDWRHMRDDELWAIAAYLKRAVKPVHNKVVESEGPPDFWASEYQEWPPLKMGPLKPAAFPTANERVPEPAAAARPK
jgi:mono/diheme cytochrome c family protein